MMDATFMEGVDKCRTGAVRSELSDSERIFKELLVGVPCIHVLVG